MTFFLYLFDLALPHHLLISKISGQLLGEKEKKFSHAQLHFYFLADVVAYKRQREKKERLDVKRGRGKNPSKLKNVDTG